MLRRTLPSSAFAFRTFAFALCTLFFAGCGGGGATSSSTPVTTPGISTSTLSTFTAAIGASSSQTLTLTNTGSATLTLSSVAVSTPSAFTLASACGSSLAPSTTCTVAITFTPTAVGAATATVTLTDNAAGSPQTVTLNGTGTAAAAPALSFSTLTAFNANAGSTSAPQTLTVTNTGTASVTFSTIALGGANGSAFNFAGNSCTAVLAPGASCSITLTFLASTGASYTGSLIFTDNVTGSPQSVPLTATGVGSYASVSPTSLTFPATAIGSAAPVQSVVLTNTGNIALTISTINVTNSAGTSFAQTNNCPATVAVNGSCTISVTFTPSASGTLFGNVNIGSNAVGSTASFSLTGSGTAPSITLTPGSLTFPSTNIGVAAAGQSFAVTNYGTAPLAISSIGITGSAASSFAQTNTCGSSLAVNASCAITVTFTPATAGTLTAAIAITDNAPSSPQSFTLTGTGVGPVAGLSGTRLTFTSPLNVTTSSQSVTLSNPGGATLNIGSITLAGTNASSFAKTTTCGATLAAGASCTLSATFTPTAATGYSATITLTDNAPDSPQVITLAGTGTSSNASITYQLYQLPDPGTGAGSGTMAALYALVNNAHNTIDLTMYAMQDTTFSGYLVTACQRGVIVRAVFDQNSEKSRDTPAYNQLNAQPNCSAVWANKAFAVTHEKSMIVDGTTLALMSLNLEAQFYSTTRDFAMVYNDPADVAAVQATFNMDYAAGTPASGVAGASDLSYSPGPGSDLIWSPTTAQTNMEKIINNATTTLIIDAEELTSSASYIVTDIANACKRGVTVRATIENESHAYDAQFTTLKSAGCPIHYYSSSTGFYVHAKSVIADYGLATQSAYMGSINYSNASMNSNRELGMFVTDNASIQTMYNAMVSDYNNATGIF